MLYKVTFHLSDGSEIVVDDVIAENQGDAWKQVCRQDEQSYLIELASKNISHKVFKAHLVSIETKDKSATSLKNTEAAMTAMDALSNMGL